MNEPVVTNPPEIREKATGRVVFRVTPKQAYLLKRVVEDCAKTNRAHNTSDTLLWLVAHYQDLCRAESLINAFRKRQEAEVEIHAQIAV